MRKDSESIKAVPKEVADGASVYSNLLLSVYDIEVLMFELPYIFKCPLHEVKDFFNKNVSGERPRSSYMAYNSEALPAVSEKKPDGTRFPRVSILQP